MLIIVPQVGALTKTGEIPVFFGSFGTEPRTYTQVGMSLSRYAAGLRITKLDCSGSC